MKELDAANYNVLVSALQLVALPYQEQIDALAEFVCVAHEVALIFEDSFLAARNVIDERPDRNNVRGFLEELSDRFGEMSNDKEMWTVEALQTKYA